jgi:hypothetical protein
MARQSVHRTIWALVSSQHGVVTRAQLRELGLSDEAIDHRMETGRLRPVFRGVYAVGRPDVTRWGRWMAATLACGPGAAVSHDDAAALYGIRSSRRHSAIEISVPASSNPRPPGIAVHRRKVRIDRIRRHNIPVTTPLCTLVDLAARLPRDDLEAAINEADKLDLIGVEALRSGLDTLERRLGLATLRTLIDVQTFVYTDSKLERDFLPIIRRVGLPLPETRRYVNSFRVDFYWAELELVVETDGLRYHRTPGQQATDLVRDQTHAASGLERLRFSHGQIRYEPEYVERILAAVVRRLELAA